mgnify:CR=1 FL=1
MKDNEEIKRPNMMGKIDLNTVSDQGLKEWVRTLPYGEQWEQVVIELGTRLSRSKKKDSL